MKKSNLIMMVTTVFVFIVLLVGATYSYFASNAVTGNGLDMTITTDNNNVAFAATEGALSMHVKAEDMLQSQTGSGDVLAAETVGEDNIIVTLSTSTDANISCTYNVYFQWNTNQAYLTPTDSSKNELTIEFSLEDEDGTGSEGNNKFSNETQITKVVTSSSKTKIIEGASIMASASNGGLQEWVPTVRFYNLAKDQSALAGKTFGGKFTIDDVECDKVKTLSETIVAQVSDNEYTSGQDQSKYLVKHEMIYDYEYTTFTENDYKNVEMSARTSPDGLEYTEVTGKTPFIFENGKWNSVQINDSSESTASFDMSFASKDTYQLCAKATGGGAYTILSIIIKNPVGDTIKRIDVYGDETICHNLGVIEKDASIHIENYQHIDYYAQTEFYIQHAKVIDSADAGIRFEGTDPNNYIEFNGGEEWRIIGVFEGSTIGLEPGKQYTKIIKTASIGHYSWNCNSMGIGGAAMEYTCLENGENNWEESSLKKYLNGDYYNNLSDKNKIAKYDGHYSTWYLKGAGDIESNSATRSDWFKYERYTGKTGYKNSVQYSASATIQAAIGIMYPSDYGYAAYCSYCTDTEITPLSSFIMSSAAYYSWLYDWVGFSFLISPSPDSQYNVYSLNSASGMDVRAYDTGTGGSGWGDGLNTFPTLYLETNLIAQGTGTKTDPYRIIN